jgi:hypothetical protein
MRAEVDSALAQLRREIDVLHASILARSRLAAPEILTPQRVSTGVDRALVRTLEPPTVPVLPAEAPPTLFDEPGIAESDRIALPDSRTSSSGLFRRVIQLVRRLLRAFGYPFVARS